MQSQSRTVIRPPVGTSASFSTPEGGKGWEISHHSTIQVKPFPSRENTTHPKSKILFAFQLRDGREMAILRVLFVLES
ncbi:hypothetical protein BofuT4_uP120920.1 [Botrytis cinerea T4]|uniref:Uncharacterized protein n=1 Tax=Botryotinia fuckeliana (strain T4) TaxID=999810 RepID=G2YN75_BOTF4|nr:hypothetical protein BofuT4_uP120920.1 [Botrytis cinerea T4]